MTIGSLIKRARKKAGLTQRELAEKSGTATGTIQQYELGKRQPRLEQLQAIATALGTTVNWLLPPENYWEDEHGVGRSEPMPEVSELVLEKRLQDSYGSLTLEGKKKAVDRVEELAEIPRYKAGGTPAEASQSTPTPPEGQSTTPPPEGE